MERHSEPTVALTHSHVFLGAGHEKNERKTWAVIILCGVMMLVEIVGGSVFGSLALIADGLHMSTHAGAMLIAALAYTYARRHATDNRFVFGTGKLGDLAGFTSAIVLALIAVLIGYEAVVRFFAPVGIEFSEAIPIAIAGLAVNVVSAWLLAGGEHHGHSHGGSGHTHGDDHGRAQPRDQTYARDHGHHHGHDDVRDRDPAHGHDDTHGHGHDDTHGHGHDDTHGHGHDDTHGHGHDDTHGHGHDDTHGHGHDDTHGHGHDDTHGHGHDDTLGHGRDDTHGRGRDDIRGRDHDDDHGHNHDDDHGHNRGLVHDHRHDHVNEPDHAHSHEPASQPASLTPGHGHAPGRPAQATTRDNSIRSAYVHVLADTFVSVLAITGLLLAKLYGWLWMDPLAGIIGAVVIANWSITLIRDTAGVLLDVCPDELTREKVRRTLEADGDRVVDLHLWRLGPGHLAAVLAIATSKPRDALFYRGRLSSFECLSHITVEVNKGSAS